MEQPTNFRLRKVPSDLAIIEVLTNSQSFPTKIEAKLCRNMTECLWSYIVLMAMNSKLKKMLELNVQFSFSGKCMDNPR